MKLGITRRNGVADISITIFPAPKELPVPESFPLTLMVVVDAEEEFDWNAPFDPHSVGVSNIARQPRAQAILDEHGIRPTYMVDYPVAVTGQSRDVLGEIAASNRCDIGAHLHPWVTPPHEGPVDERTSYPGNLPPKLERAKLEVLTEAIEAGFGQRPVMYRAGRYGIGAATMTALGALGYRVDSSVVPFTDFSAGEGPDFTAFGETPFMISDRMVEMPLSVGFAGVLAGSGPRLYPMLGTGVAQRFRLHGVAARSGMLERLRLSPEGHTLADMIRQTVAAKARGTRLFMVTYHSSSLLPGGTPYARDEAACRALLRTLAGYCSYFMGPLGGQPGTLMGSAAALAGW